MIGIARVFEIVREAVTMGIPAGDDYEEPFDEDSDTDEPEPDEKDDEEGK